MYNEKIIDVVTGEEIIRPYTKEEIEKAKKLEIEAKERTEAAIIVEQNRVSALAKLAALGLTEEEIAAL